MKKNAVVIGYGGMGGWHTEHLLKSDVCNLIGVYDIKEERNELARSRGIFAYDTYKAVLDDPRVDLLTVAIPNDQHRDVVIQGLNGGKNVICEKPVAMSSAELADMIKAAERNNKIFSVHQNRRWDVDYLAMKQLSESGEIGEVFNIESRIHGSRGIPSDWRGELAHGGGMLFDWGVHLIDQILMIIPDKITSVYCRFDHITNNEVDDGFKLDLGFENGAKAYIEVGTYNFIAMPRFYIQGKKGTGIIHDWRQNCKVTVCTHWHESEVVPVQTAAGLTKTMAPRDSVTTDEYELDRPLSDVHEYYRNFCAVIDGSADLIVTHSQAMRVMHVIEASFESNARGQIIKTEL
jgi:scyllo-inositol 2-dehydrogenase (NADP+)